MDYGYIKKIAHMETINHINKETLQTMLKEVVDWIDEQDLIKREDVLDEALCRYGKDDNCFTPVDFDCSHCDYNSVDIYTIRKIPKAEPSKE